MSIIEKLNNWKKDSLFGERSFSKQEATLLEGQELYLITMKAKVTFDGESKLIEKRKFFQTIVQGTKGTTEINAQADDYICTRVLAQLETDFFSDYNEFLNQEAKRKLEK